MHATTRTRRARRILLWILAGAAVVAPVGLLVDLAVQGNPAPAFWVSIGVTVVATGLLGMIKLDDVDLHQVLPGVLGTLAVAGGLPALAWFVWDLPVPATIGAVVLAVALAIMAVRAVVTDTSPLPAAPRWLPERRDRDPYPDRYGSDLAEDADAPQRPPGPVSGASQLGAAALVTVAVVRLSWPEVVISGSLTAVALLAGICLVLISGLVRWLTTAAPAPARLHGAAASARYRARASVDQSADGNDSREELYAAAVRDAAAIGIPPSEFGHVRDLIRAFERNRPDRRLGRELYDRLHVLQDFVSVHDAPAVSRWSELELRRVQNAEDDGRERGRDLRESYQRGFDRPLLDTLRQPLSTPRSIYTLARVADQLGLVLDAVWPRIRGVLSPADRRATAAKELVLAGYRLAAASTLAFAILTVAIGALRGSLDLVLIGALAVVATAFVIGSARRVVSDVRARRADLVALHRADLAAALRLGLPATSDGLVALGAVLTGSAERYPLAAELIAGASPASVTVNAPVTTQITDEHLATLRDGLADRLPERIGDRISEVLTDQVEALRQPPSTVEMGADGLDSLARQVADNLTDPVQRSLDDRLRTLESALSSSLARALDESVQGPALAPYIGYLMVSAAAPDGGDNLRDGSVRVPAGDPLRLELSIIGDERARSAAPERGSASGDYAALQPIVIPGTPSSAPVEFEIVVDSSTLTATPGRCDLLVAASGGGTRTVDLGVVDGAGRHEAWIQVFQMGRLIEVVVLPIVVAEPAQDAG